MIYNKGDKIIANKRMIEYETGYILANPGDELIIEGALFQDKGILYVKNKQGDIWSIRIKEGGSNISFDF